MVRFLTHPDLEAVAATALRNASISGVLGVYSSLPKTFTPPVITVNRVGGEPSVREYQDAARLEIEVWGSSKSEALDIAQAARVVLLELEGTNVTSPVRAAIGGVRDARGITWEPDRSTGRDRYVFAMTVHGRTF